MTGTMLEPPFPELDELMAQAGEVGRRLSEIEACEGAAGNISLCLRWPVEPGRFFPCRQPLVLPLPAPALAGCTLLVTGSGCRLRDIAKDPGANLGCVVVDEGGLTGCLYTTARRLFTRPTSEFNSHLAVHQEQAAAATGSFQALVHAQPPHLTYLSHIPCYQETLFFNRRVLRWQPEAILQLPEGIGVVPFLVPGSAHLMSATIEALRAHRLVVWGKHGVMARAGSSILHACDLVEYAEAGARYEYMDLASGGQGQGLSDAEIHAICQAFGVQQGIFLSGGEGG